MLIFTMWRWGARSSAFLENPLVGVAGTLHFTHTSSYEFQGPATAQRGLPILAIASILLSRLYLYTVSRLAQCKQQYIVGCMVIFRLSLHIHQLRGDTSSTEGQAKEGGQVCFT